MKDLFEINRDNKVETINKLKEYKEQYKKELEQSRKYTNLLIKHINDIDIMIAEIENEK